MLFPVKILDFDLAAPSTGDIPVSSRYRRARVLVRWSGHPIGTVHVSVHSGAVRRQDILAAVVDKLAYSLAVEFARHSLLHTGAPGSFQPASRSAFSLRRDAPGVSVVICTRDRPDDIAPLLQSLVSRCLGRLGARLDAASLIGPWLPRMQRYAWPGNVRELENISERIAVFLLQYARAEDVDHDALRHDCPELFEGTAPPRGPGDAQSPRERALQALRASGGNRQEAARRLGVSRSTLWRWASLPPT